CRQQLLGLLRKQGAAAVQLVPAEHAWLAQELHAIALTVAQLRIIVAVQPLCRCRTGLSRQCCLVQGAMFLYFATAAENLLSILAVSLDAVVLGAQQMQLSIGLQKLVTFIDAVMHQHTLLGYPIDNSGVVLDRQ